MNHRGRVLIVEDERSTLDRISEAFAGMNFEVVKAVNGHEALLKFAPHRYDIVLSEPALPETDGPGLLDAIRRLDREVVFFLANGYPRTAAGLKAARKGLCDYVTEPIDMEEFRRKVTRALENKRINGEMRSLGKGFLWGGIFSLTAWAAVGVILAHLMLH
jgi:DNA-binding NtrC family response regulator